MLLKILQIPVNKIFSVHVMFVMIYPMEHISSFFLIFALHVLRLSFSKSKGQVISHMMCHVQVM
jgi:hypothetical protein